MSGSSNQSSRDSIVTLFDTFRDEIDDFNDRRERLIKVRTIFPATVVDSTRSPINMLVV